jgi:hypothetical protein
VCDETGSPALRPIAGRFIEFDVSIDERRYTIRCPLRYGGYEASTLRVVKERSNGLGSKFFSEWDLLPGEVVLFDYSGSCLQVDALIRPAPVGEPFIDFLEKAAARGNTASVSAVMHFFEELVLWVKNVGRSGIAPENLYVAPNGTITITGFSANDRTEHIFEMLHAASDGKRTVDMPRKTDIITDYGLDGDKDIHVVRDGGGWTYVDNYGRTLTNTVWLSASPFRKQRAEVESRTGKGLIDIMGRTVLQPVYEELVWDDGWGVASVMTDGQWSLLDRNGILLTDESYDWLGECSEGLILAQRNGLCGFLDTSGRLVIPCIFEDASSFAEGCSLVTMNGKSFLIDAKGKRI